MRCVLETQLLFASADLHSICFKRFAETMELRGLFPNSCQQSGSFVPETHVNGNRKSISTLSTFNNVGSDNCGSMPSVQSNLRLSRGFCARLPPLGRSGTSSGLNLTNEPKQQRERTASESKLNALFDQYKVRREVAGVYISTWRTVRNVEKFKMQNLSNQAKSNISRVCF